MWPARQVVWLGLTPEPERELPVAVATLRRRTARQGARRTTRPSAARRPPASAAPAAWTAAERRRIERLILRGTQRGWLRYLSEVTSLVRGVEDGAPPLVVSAALRAAETVLDHHRMLIGLPGPGYDRVAEERAALADAVTDLRARRADAVTELRARRAA